MESERYSSQISLERVFCAGDPSLRLKCGSARDDASGDESCNIELLPHRPGESVGLFAGVDLASDFQCF